MLETVLIAFTTYFATIGPADVAALFAALTPDNTLVERRRMALKGTLIAIDMVFGRASGAPRPRARGNAQAAAKDDISVFPPATPLIAGPGAIGAIMLLAADAQGRRSVRTQDRWPGGPASSRLGAAGLT
jgi:multiple antibiotic resistance protein